MVGFTKYHRATDGGQQTVARIMVILFITEMYLNAALPKIHQLIAIV